MAKKKHSFAWSPVRRLMKQQGAKVVSKEAVDLLIDTLEKTTVKITTRAIEMTMHSSRKKITKSDIVFILNKGCFYPWC